MICVTICTRQRPKMLKRLLNSCINVTNLSEIPLRFVVIENGSVGEAANIVEEFRDILTISYRHEPRIGLVYARNAAIESFLEGEDDWMAFVDDDGALNAGWLEAYLKAIADYPDDRAFAGPDPQIELENPTRWLQRKAPSIRTYGEKVWDVSTANVLLHRSILEKTGLGMRFDMAFNFSGGEDVRFFMQLKDANEPIRWVPDAITLEKVSPERGAFKNRARRATQASQNWGKIMMLRHGNIRGGAENLYISTKCGLYFVVFGITGAFVLLVNRKKGEALVSRAVKYGCKSVGRLKANFIKLDTLYETLDGE